MAKKVLHIVKECVIDPEQKFLGSTKDTRGRTQYFKENHFLVDEVVINDGPNLDDELLLKLKGKYINEYSWIFIECMRYPKSVHYLKKTFPNVKIIFRSINAELYHKLHYSLAYLKLKRFKTAVAFVLRAFRELVQEIRCAYYADYILSISEWEAKYYWRLISSKNKIRILPFFIPKVYLTPITTNEKENNCICLMSSSSGPFPLLYDAYKNFCRLVIGMHNDYADWNFFVTGAIDEDKKITIPRINYLGHLESPLQSIAQSRAIAILSNLGFGFKTKILEGIIYGCYVLVTKKLYNRLSPSIQKYCILVNIRSLESFKIALSKSQRSFPKNPINDQLTSEAYKILDSVFQK